MYRSKLLTGALLATLVAGTSQADAATDVSFEALKYRNVGPARGGRVTAVAGTPVEPGTFYFGASGGASGRVRTTERPGITFPTDFSRHHR